MENTNSSPAQTPRFRATYHGATLGWYDTADEAQAAIDRAEQADADSDADFDRQYNPLGWGR